MMGQRWRSEQCAVLGLQEAGEAGEAGRTLSIQGPSLKTVKAPAHT